MTHHFIRCWLIKFALVLMHLMPLTFCKIACDPESFKFVDSPRNVEATGTYTFQISNDMELGCAVNATYDWVLYRKINGALVKVPEETEALKFPGQSKKMVNQVLMDRLQVEGGSSQRFVLKVTLIPDGTHYPSYREWFFGIGLDASSNLQISGGEDRTHWLDGTTLWLNASIVDEEEINGSPPERIRPVWECLPPFKGVEPTSDWIWAVPENALAAGVTYSCTVTITFPSGRKESATQKIHIDPLEKMPQIEINCLQNCEPSYANAETVLNLICHKNCEGQVVWKVEPFDDSYMNAMSSLDNNTITFKGNTFKPDTFVDIIASLGERTANLTFHFMPQTPDLEITCIENCKFDINKEIKFKVRCMHSCKLMEYYWEYRPHPENVSLNSPVNDVLTFPANSFLEKTNVTLWVQGATSSARYNFTTVDLTPELIISCIKNCEIMDPREEVEVNVKCKKNCEGAKDYRWSLDPIPVAYHWYDHTTDDNKTLIIPAYTYGNLDNVVISVFAGSGNDTSSLAFKVVNSVLKIECVQNCRPDKTHPNAHKQVKLKAKCLSGCRNKPFVWSLQPPLSSLQFQENETYLTIPADSYAEGDSVHVSVSDGWGSTMIVINYVKIKPLIRILCLKNCIKPPDPLMDTVLKVVCSEGCDGNLAYIWQLNPPPHLWYDHVKLSLDNKTITVKSGTFKGGDKVNYTVTTKNEAEDQVEFDYELLPPRFIVECIRNCNNSWINQETVLKLKCFENCYDVSYVWSIDPVRKGWKWAKYVRLSADNMTLTVNAFAFEHNDNITFTAKSRPTGQAEGGKGGSEAKVTIEFEQLTPKLIISCEPTSCEEVANRREAVLLTVKCLKNCERTSYSWDLNPQPDGFQWNTDVILGIENRTLKILPSTFDEDAQVTFTVWSDPGVASVSLTFKDPIPDLLVTCEDNCNGSDPHQSVKLSVKCNDLCDHVDMYKWEVTPPAKVSISGTKFQALVIPPDSFKDGDIVNVVAKWGLGKSSLELHFKSKKNKVRVFNRQMVDVISEESHANFPISNIATAWTHECFLFVFIPLGL